MCLGQTTQIKKLESRIHYLWIEIKLQAKLINQLKTLQESTQKLKLPTCNHVNCKIDHRKFNIVNVANLYKPNLPKVTAIRQGIEKKRCIHDKM